MYINTNLGFSFRRFEDLLQYMIEENILTVEVSTDYWGALSPKTLYNIDDIKAIVEMNKEDII